MNNFEIREATLNDALGIATVRHFGWQETYRGIVEDSFLDEMSIEESFARWKQILAQKNEIKFNAVLADEEGKIVGFVSGGRSRLKETKVEGEIYALYLLKEFHGRGLGRKLFLHAVEQLARMGFKSFCLFVLTQNPTLHFYKKFTPDIEETESVEIGEEDYDELMLGWSDIKKISR